MNDFIVTVSYLPMVYRKDKVFRVKTELSKKETKSKIEETEWEKNPLFDRIYVLVETLEEYLEDIEIREIVKM